ncbi:MAG: undecaprenyl-diphosphate phosphatase [Desulfobacteraceae bacterium]|nr:undecaprenyl-diphosphate phosphatase [Desulfobacteraceae bacterium]
MTILQAVILGIIQGLTEFLPVSSSGHLVIFQDLFHLRRPELIFDVAVHIGTLVAVWIYFYKDISAIIKAVVKWGYSLIRRADPGPATPEIRLAAMIAAGSVPTAVIGLAFHGIADILFSSVLVVGFALVATGLWMWFTRGRDRTQGDLSRLNTVRAFLIGIAQGIAVIPGISRSGATIATGLYLGLDREKAARYSFLLSIPAIAGAALLSFAGIPAAGSAKMSAVLAGSTAAALVGYAALWLLVYLVKRGRLFIFAPYCWILGGIILMLSR